MTDERGQQCHTGLSGVLNFHSVCYITGCQYFVATHIQPLGMHRTNGTDLALVLRGEMDIE